MDSMGKYIYGVIGTGRAESFPLDDVVPFAADRGPEREQAHTVSWRDISAVVTDAPVLDYTTMPKDALGRLLVRHQQVMEKVMARHTILPLRLGTCAENDEQVRGILASGYRTIQEALGKAQAVVEIDVTACLGDFASFVRHVSQARPITELRQSLLPKQGGLTVEDQAKVGMLVKQHADREKQRWAREIQTALGPVVEDFRAHDLMDDTMVLNTAFLIRKDRRETFERLVENLNAQFDDRLDFRCVGPLPPYSFYTLEVRVTRPDEVDWARRQLGLWDQAITVDAIKKAHRQAALTCHPDKHPDVPDIEKRFADMSRAYQILLDYHRTNGQTGSENKTGSAQQACEKTAVLVTLR